MDKAYPGNVRQMAANEVGRLLDIKRFVHGLERLHGGILVGTFRSEGSNGIMRTINKIVIHHTATSAYTSVDSIRDYHMNELGWRDIGYHYIINSDGMLRLGRPDWMIGAHVKGQNRDSIGVAVIGNFEDYTFLAAGKWLTPQGRMLPTVLADLMHRYPAAEVVTHREIAATLCPGVNLQNWVEKKWGK